MTIAMFIITSNNKHLNRFGDILVSICSGVKTMADWWQLTQGGSKVKLQCQSTIVGGACAEQRHSAKNLRSAWYEKRVKIYVNYKIPLGGFLSL